MKRGKHTHTRAQSTVMSLGVWLLFILCCCTVGAPVQRTARWTEADPGQTDSWRTASSYHRLPVFLHAPRPLVARDVIRPVHEHRAPQDDLTALLLPLPAPPGSPGGAERRPVEVWCGMSSVSVRLDRLLLRAWPSPSQFRLGFCGPQKVTRRFIYFHSGLTDCDVESKVVADQLMYSTSLFYNSLPESPVIRVPPLNLPIHCQYNRFHYSYKVGFRPEVQHAIYAKTVRSKVVFSLTVCNAQWEALPPSSSFLLGEQLYFIARAGSLLPRERLYVDSCYASSSKDPNSLPKVHLISNYGCMMDSRRESSDSRFVWRGANELWFSVDAFLFKASQISQVQYLHCSMSVGLTASDTSKTCNYNRAVGRWEEMESSNLVCACCDSVCNEKQHSIKRTTSSIGWHVKLNDENPRTRTSVPEKEILFVKKGNKRNKGVNPDLQVEKFQRSAITGPEETTLWKMGTINQEATKERTSNVTNMMAVDDLKGGAFNGILSDESRAFISNQLSEEFNESKSTLVGIFNDSDLNLTSGKGFSNTANLDIICNTNDHCTDVDVVLLTEIPHTPNSNDTSSKPSDVSIHFYNKSAELNWKNSNQSLDSHNLEDHKW